MTTDEKPAEPGRAELRLRLTHSRGHARDGACAFPIEGAGMANALELDGSRPSHAQWHGANLCRISCQSGGWQLQNRNPKLVCALNGQRLTLDLAMPLSVGDVIEVGLMRFVVEAIVAVTRSAAADARPHAPPGVEPGAPEERANRAAASAGGDGRRALSDATVAGPPARGTNAAPGNTAFDEGSFNLRDLASPTSVGSEGHAWLSSRSDSPFATWGRRALPRVPAATGVGSGLSGRRRCAGAFAGDGAQGPFRDVARREFGPVAKRTSCA